MSHDWPDRWLLAAAADPRTGLWGLVRGGPEPQAALAKLGSPAAEWHPEPELELAVTDDGFATPLARTPEATDALWLLRIAGPQEAPGIAVARPELSKLDSIRVLAACFPQRACHRAGGPCFGPRAGERTRRSCRSWSREQT